MGKLDTEIEAQLRMSDYTSALAQASLKEPGLEIG
jgi:hypothetical protein